MEKRMTEQPRTEDKMTRERIHEIAALLLGLRVVLTKVTEDEINEILRGLNNDEAMGPLLNPSAWQGGRFNVNRRSRTFLEKLLALKVESDY